MNTENRQRGRFAGFSLFVSKSGVIQGSTLCYKNNSQLPTLNFTATCPVYGRYVIYYNERLDIVTYPSGYELFVVSTEICEIIVQGTAVKFDIIKHYQIYFYVFRAKECSKNILYIAWCSIFCGQIIFEQVSVDLK